MSFEMFSDFLSLNELLTVPAILSLLTVSFMGVVLGIDNVVFIAVIAKRAPRGQEDRARTLGIIMAMVARIALIFSIGLLLRFENVHLFTVPFMPDHHQDITVKGAILVIGGVFLIYKATQEIFEKLEGDDHHADGQAKRLPLGQILFTLLLLNLVFSIDSVLTAVGIAYNQLVPDYGRWRTDLHLYHVGRRWTADPFHGASPNDRDVGLCLYAADRCHSAG